MTDYKLLTLIDSYLQYLVSERGAANGTIVNYEHYLNRFVEFTGAITTSKLTPELLREFRAYLAQSKLSRATQNYHLIALRSFLKYLDSRDIPAPSFTKIEIPKQIRPLMPVLDGNEPERLLRAASGNNLLTLRDRCILEVLLGSGLRVSELVSLDREQINFDSMAFTIRGKGSKDRIVFLTPESAKWLKKYLSVRYDSSPALFVELASTEAHRLQQRSVQRLVHHYAQLAGITKPITPHSLRHTFATNLHGNGADLMSVKELLGHASISTTQIYTHISNPQLQNAHKQFSGYGTNRKDNI